jgi:hypothetical protein
MALTRIKNKALSSLLDANEDVNSANLDNVPASDNASALTTGTLPDARLSNQVKVVKATSAPGSPQEGDLWYDTTNDLLKVYDTTTTAFVKVVTVTPTLSSIDGAILNATAGNLTLNGTGFLASGLVVSFTPSGGSASNVTVTPTNDATATVAIPSVIYGQSTNTVIGIKVTNSDGKESATINKTVSVLPTGGTISTSGNYTIHTFTSSGNFNNTITGLEVEYLVIAGGGGSGRQHGGGGGGGGYRCSVVGENSGAGSSAETKLTLSTTGNKTVTIGAGGTGSSGTGVAGTNGENSVFDTITSTGGGGGGSFHSTLSSASDGLDGGSGGGAGAYSASNSACGTGADGGTATANQGMNGGDANYAGGGGGGASVVGEAGCNASPCGDAGNGGAGEDSAITGSTVGRAGGGAGGSYGGSNQSCGSRGIATDGAGNGGWGAEGGTNGTANTGGGAGAGGVLANGASNGGSGIVIVRYIV